MDLYTCAITDNFVLTVIQTILLEIIRDWISNGDWEWTWSGQNLCGRHSKALNMLLSELVNVELSSGMDAHQWCLFNDGDFSDQLENILTISCFLHCLSVQDGINICLGR